MPRKSAEYAVLCIPVCPALAKTRTGPVVLRRAIEDDLFQYRRRDGIGEAPREASFEEAVRRVDPLECM